MDGRNGDDWKPSHGHRCNPFLPVNPPASARKPEPQQLLHQRAAGFGSLEAAQLAICVPPACLHRIRLSSPDLVRLYPFRSCHLKPAWGNKYPRAAPGAVMQGVLRTVDNNFTTGDVSWG